MPIDLKLEGKVAIVTGGTRGLGAASVRLLAADGARLVLTDRDLGELEAFAEELRGAHGAEVVVAPSDLTPTRRRQTPSRPARSRRSRASTY